MPQKTMGNITQAEIAKQLNVSRTTVARALYDRGYVNCDLKAEIIKLAESSGYKPNNIARSLVRKREFHVQCFLTSYDKSFAQQLEDGIRMAEKEFSDFGLSATIHYHTPNDPNGQVTDFENVLQGGGVDAVLMSAMDPSSILHILRKNKLEGLPLAALNLQMPSKNRLFYVGTNDFQSGEIAADMMAKLICGTGRVLYVNNYSTHPSLVERTQGFVQYLQSFPRIHLQVEHSWVDPSRFYAYTQKALKDLPDLAGICSNTSISGIDKALQKENRRDIKLIGNDYSKEEDHFIEDGTLDCLVCQRPTLQGYLGFKYMAKYLLNNERPKNWDTYVGFDLITCANMSTDEYFHLL